jgi:hypothetical protein
VADVASFSLPADRRISASGLARLLGSWATTGRAYTSVSDGVRRAILDGTLPLGTRLPSERELADVLGVSSVCATTGSS